MCTRVECFFEI